MTAYDALESVIGPDSTVHAPDIRVFGSVARGEATPGSDLDLLADVDRGHGYFDMAEFALGVEDVLGVMTHVATPGGLKVRIRDRVLRGGRRPVSRGGERR